MVLSHALRERVGKHPLYRVSREGRDLWVGLTKVAQPRAFQAYCIGTPKSGTHSLADTFAARIRGAHEPSAFQLLSTLEGAPFYQQPTARVARMLRVRDFRLRLELESSHLLGPFAAALVQLFPHARFVLTVRDPRSWLDSQLNDQLNGLASRDAGFAHYNKAFDFYFQRSRFVHPPQEAVLQAAGLHTLDGYLSYWTEHNASILACVPTERLCLVQTDAINRSIERIAQFMGIAPHESQIAPVQSYASPNKHGMLQRLDPGYVDQKIAQHCAALWQQIRQKTARL